MLTDVTYIGNSLSDEGYAATICQTHNWREQARFVYELENFECPTCVHMAVKEHDERAARADMLAGLGHPSICLCPTCAPHEAEYDRMQAEETARLNLGEIRSPNYCDHLETAWGTCSMSGCRHAACHAEPPF